MGIARKAGLQFDFRERRCGYFNKTSKQAECILAESTGVFPDVWQTDGIKDRRGITYGTGNTDTA